MQDIVDNSDFCRKCKGSGVHHERTQRDTILIEDCWQCRGTGFRTVLVGPKA